MAKHKKKVKFGRPASASPPVIAGKVGVCRQYEHACRLARDGRHDEARRLYAEVKSASSDPALGACAMNDLAVLDALDEDFETARRGFEHALRLDPTCESARLNLAMLVSCGCGTTDSADASSPSPVSLVPPMNGDSNGLERAVPPAPHLPNARIRVAVLSFLFNWPSTGGGNIHTLELVQFLSRAGYDVSHYYARFPDWGIGNVQSDIPIPSEALEFDPASWNATSIQLRFRAAVDRFAPDYVIIADSWNMKPILAEAVAHYPYFLRFQAQECLCPLNNLRLLAESPTTVVQCNRSQLATPEICRKCIADRGHQSGALHQAERGLAGVGTNEYDVHLRRSLSER